ncbi:MAG: nucleotidyltransferase domain-containing protein [Prevotellaceae bacterium]|jgi:predicted nucleotidyltransferase|nr:nucleotidyltransferase domain-containing protein [Prevotellaceae bacterium]
MQQSFLHTIQQCLAPLPIEKAWLFGSYSRGEETKESDVDLLVRFDNDASITLFQYAHMVDILQKALHREVDLVEEGQVKEFAKESVERDKVLVYERKS